MTVATPTRVTIRQGGVEDAAVVRTLVDHFIAETDYHAIIGPKTDRLDATIQGLLSGEIGALLLAERDAEVIGLIAVVVYQHFVSGELVGSELVWWVEPSARSTRAGLLLIKAAEACARAQGAVLMQFGAWHDRLGSFYERLGYRPMEQIYQKRLTEEFHP